MPLKNKIRVTDWCGCALIMIALFIPGYAMCNEDKDEVHKAKELAKCFGIELAAAEYMESKNVKSGSQLLRLRADKYYIASIFFFISSGVIPHEKAKMAVIDYATEANISYAAELESGFALGHKIETISKRQIECYKNWGDLAAAAADLIKENSYTTD